MVSVYKANDKKFVLYRRDTDGEIIKTPPKEMIFSVKPKFDSSEILIIKTLGYGIEQADDGGWIININAMDTQNINIIGEKAVYLCDVRIVDEFDETRTIVKPQDFVVLAWNTGIM